MATMARCRGCKQAFVREKKELLCVRCESEYMKDENALSNKCQEPEQAVVRVIPQVKVKHKRLRFDSKGMKAYDENGRYNISPEYTQAKIDHWQEVARRARLCITE